MKIMKIIQEKDLGFKLLFILPVAVGLLFGYLNLKLYFLFTDFKQIFYYQGVIILMFLILYSMFFRYEVKKLTRNEIKNKILNMVLGLLVPIVTITIILFLGIKDFINQPVETKETQKE
jgi:hypothetical protein